MSENTVDDYIVAYGGAKRALSKAIAEAAGMKFKGFVAWLMWLFLHVFFLIGFRNRLAVMFSWFWAYLTRERSARLITGDADEMRDATSFLEARSAKDAATNKAKKRAAVKTESG